MPVSGDKVRQRREAAGLTPSQAAARVGVALPNYSRLEHGRNPNPKVGLLEALADAFGCTVNDFLTKQRGRS